MSSSCSSHPVAAVTGWPAAHSLSPLIMQTWLKETGVSGRYKILEVKPDDFATEVCTEIGKSLIGVNVTVPHKETALKLADSSSQAAQAIGAANVLTFRDGKLFADNTDIVGIASALESDTGIGPAVLIGAGGAARAALYHLSCQDREIRIVNRTLSRAQALADEFDVRAKIYPLDDDTAFKDANLVVNASALGMTGQPSLKVNLSDTDAQALVFDMVYSPLKTDLLNQAEILGRRWCDGLTMLIGQARPAFEMFFGAPAPHHNDVRDRLIKALESRS